MNNLDRKEWIDSAIDSFLQTWSTPTVPGIEKLKESIDYSYSRGGKRFRPLLSLLIAETFAVHPKRILPWAMAVEMIHTYSLIHDDLPCMDNDDYRRGEPTNHKIFGETTALLAGDALLTEAFGLVATAYTQEAALGLRLVQLLAAASGLNGMVGGQAIDLEFQSQKPDLPILEQMHRMKTGALIRVSAEGAAWVCGLPLEKIESCRRFGENLGLAFQIKDDLLDAMEKEETGSFPGVIGAGASQRFLLEVSQKAKEDLISLQITQGPLLDLVESNLTREK